MGTVDGRSFGHPEFLLEKLDWRDTSATSEHLISSVHFATDFECIHLLLEHFSKPGVMDADAYVGHLLIESPTVTEHDWNVVFGQVMDG